MSSLSIIPLLIISAGFLACRVGGAEFDFYERFSSLLETNSCGPNLTNRTLLLNNLRQNGDVAGVKIGTSMSAAVELWGKPRNFYASCGGGPVLMFGHGVLNFRGQQVVRMSIDPHNIPGVRFEKGLTATNTPLEFAQGLGWNAAPGPAQWYLITESESGRMELQWTHFAVDGWQLSSVTFEAPGLRSTPDR